MLDKVIHDEVQASLAWLKTKDQGLSEQLDKSYGYAVFPAMGRSGLVLGGATGGGEVFEQKKPVGLAKLSQLTVGVQVGGQTFTELVFFHDKNTLDAFKKGEIHFTANASAVLIKAAATGTSGASRKAYSRGGMLLELSLGGQKFRFLPHEFKFLEDGHGAEGATPAAPEHGEGNEHAPQGELGAQQAAAAPSPKDEPKGEMKPQGQDDEANPQEAEQAPASGDHEAPGGFARSARRVFQAASEKAPHVLGAEARERVTASTRKLVGKAVGGAVGNAVGDAVSHAVSRASAKTAQVLRSQGLTGGRLGFLTSRTLEPWLKPVRKIESSLAALGEETSTARVLEAETKAALARMKAKRPGLDKQLESAYGYALFPSAGKASAVLGGSYGRGAVFEHGKLAGYAAIVQMTIGVQLGGESFDELVVFETRSAFDRFKGGKIAFAANASAAFLSTGAAATNDYATGTKVVLHSQGGLILETAIGAQKFVFRSKVLGTGQRKS